MRNSILFLAMFLVVSFAFVGCDENNNMFDAEPAALTEQDFVADPDMAADPDEKVILLSLEPQSAPEVENLTGELGFDVIPFNYERTVNQTFCWPDNNLENQHEMKLFDSEGFELTNINSNGECDTVTLTPGRYEMHLFHHNQSDEFFTIFIQPNVDSSEIARNMPLSERIITKLLRFLSILDSSEQSLAQSSDLTKLINTKTCENCDLSNTVIMVAAETCPANFTTGTFIDVTGSNFSGSEFKGALWCWAEMGNANFAGATFDQTNSFFATNFTGSNFTNSIITAASFRAANLSGADFTGANIKGTTVKNENDIVGDIDLTPDFSESDFTSNPDTNLPTNFANATIDKADFEDVRNFNEANFNNTVITNSNLSGLDLTGLFFLSGCNLMGSDLSDTNISNTVYNEATFDNVDFNDANLSGFTCVDCSFTGANFDGANVTGINIDATGATWTDGSCTCTDSDCSNCS